MKNYAKIGNRKSRPAYRTPSRFIYKKTLEVKKAAARTWNSAKRLEFKKGKRRLSAHP